MSDEIYKDIIGYEGSYQISTLGNVKALNRVSDGCKKRKLNERILCKGLNKYTGYQLVILCHHDSGKFIKKTKSIHRLVAMAFIPNPNNYRTVNHKNGIKIDNSVNNLEWMSYSQQEIHAWGTGLKKKNIHFNPSAKKAQAARRIKINILKDGLFFSKANSLIEASVIIGKSRSGVGWAFRNKKSISGFSFRKDQNN